jgi:menaquinone-dependent protoporphyrinogen oxidase
METIILYDSKHGTTEKCAQMLAKELEGNITICNLKKEEIVDLESYDQIIIGGSVYMGQMPKSIKALFVKYEVVLLTKPLGLFACGMAEGEEATKELATIFPKEFSNHAKAIGFFGGAFYLNRMNFFEKGVIKMASKSKGAIEFEKGSEGEFKESINESEITNFAAKMKAV